MARLVGLISPWHDNLQEIRLHEMIGKFIVPPSSAIVTKTGRGFGFGILGKRLAPAAVLTVGGVTVMLDGYVYESPLDSKVKPILSSIIDSYRNVGFKETLRRTNGDFAIALFDATSHTLWLARDRIGTRPLYFCRKKDEFFAFSSQPSPLLGLPGMGRTLNRRYVGLFAGSHYRTFDNSPDESPFAEISQLPAGSFAEVRADREPRISEYWTLEEQPDFSADKETLAEEYRQHLFDAVQRRLKFADNPGFLLSGGMDSSSVLSSAVRITGSRQRAFSSVYADRTYDESDDIRSMLDSAVEAWSPVPIENPNLVDVVEQMIRVHDEPVATATWLSHYAVCESASRAGVSSLFGGLGGDELNAGEYEHFFFRFADLRLAGEEVELEKDVAEWIRYHDHPIYKKDFKLVESMLSSVVDLDTPGLCLPDRRRIDRYSSVVNREYFDVKKYTPIMDRKFSSYLKNRTYQDIFRETAPCCLRAEDRQASAFGIDHFDPFFDYRLVEFMFRVPGHLKISRGITKVLLREATRGLLPEETRTRIKKTGWNAPAHVWFTGRNLDLMRDIVTSTSFRQRGIYNFAEVERLIDEHETIVNDGLPTDNHMMFLWQLLNLELWHRQLDTL